MLVAAVITAAALLLGSGSTIPADRAGRIYAYTSRPFRPLSQAQMRRQGELLGAECGIGHGGHRSPTAPLPQVTLAAAHGGSTVHLYEIGQQTLVCSSDLTVGSSLAGAQQEPRGPSADSISFGSVTAGESHGHRATLEYGRSGAAVRAVEFVLADGTNVAASVGHGWFLIWWPSGESPTVAKLTTASGVRTVVLGAQAASPSLNCPHYAGCFATASSAVAASGVGTSERGSGKVGAALGLQAPAPLQTSIGPRQTGRDPVAHTQIAPG